MSMKPAATFGIAVKAGVTLDGKLIAWRNSGSMVLFTMEPSPHLYVACFSTKENLEKTLTRSRTQWDTIKQITNGNEFVDNLPRFLGPQEIKIIIDPWYTPENTVRYTAVERLPIIGKVEQLN
jgi:hypothetical protein